MRRIITLFAASLLLAGNINAQVAYYPFNGNTNDSSGNGHSLISTAITYGTGKDGVPNSAASFNGSTTWLYTNNFLAGKDSFSISLWVKSTKATQRAALAYAGNSNSDGSGLVLDMCNTLNDGDNISPLCGGVRWLCNNNVHLSQSVWTHVAMVKASKSFKLFINGSQVHADTCTIKSPSNYFTVGGNLIGGSGNSLTGLIDELKVFDYSLTNSQVNVLYTGVTGVSQIENNTYVYPNPLHSNEKLKISLANISFSNKVFLYSIEGSLIGVYELDESGEILIADKLHNGMYLLRLSSRDESQVVNLKLLVLD